MTLSPAGWPRPRTPDGRFPVPWIAPVENLAAKHKRRLRDTRTGNRCQVCGLPFDGDGPAYAVVNIDARPDRVDYPPGSRLPDDVGVQAMDDGLLHWRCLRLALAYCPELQRLLAADELRIVEVPPREGIVVSGSACVVVDLAEALAGGAPHADAPEDRRR